MRAPTKRATIRGGSQASEASALFSIIGAKETSAKLVNEEGALQAADQGEGG